LAGLFALKTVSSTPRIAPRIPLVRARCHYSILQQLL
jgi:hypothetical protein